MDMTAMTAAVGVVVAVIVCTVLTIIAKFGFRERDYDDVYRQQERLPAPTSKKAPKKKKLKVKGGTQSDVVTSDDEGKTASSQAEDLPDDNGARSAAVEHLHVEYDPDPVIIDEPQSDSKSKAKQAPKKSILRNRSDSLKEAEAAATAVQPAAEAVTRRGSGSFSRIPKDEVELKHHPDSKRRHSTAKAVAPAPDQIASSSASKEPQPEEVVEIIRAVTYESVQQAPSLISSTSIVSQPIATKQPSPPPAADVSRKEKSKNSKQARTTEVSALAAAIQNASLSKADVQELVDLLLGKEESAVSWTMKAQRGDPVAQLTKQLEDKDRQLVEERQQVSAAAAKVSKLEKSFQEERAKRAQSEQQAADRTAALDAELTALKQRMQQTHEQHIRDLAAASSRQQHGAAADTQELAATISRLKQENQQLKEAMPSPSEMKALKEQAQIVKNELAKSIQNLNLADNARSQAELRCRRLEEQVATKEKLLCQQLDGVKQELQRSELLRQDQAAAAVRAERAVAEAVQGKQEAEHRVVQLNIELRQASAGTDLAVMEKDKEIQTLKQQLAVAESKLRMMDSSSQSAAAAEVEHYKAKLLKSQAEIDRIQAVVCELQQQQPVPIAIASQQQAGAADGGEQLTEAAARWAVEAEGLTRAKQQLEQELHQLREQLRQTDSGLQAELGEAKRRNDELRRKNWSLVEALASAESLGTQVPELRQQLDGARASLDTSMTRVQRLEEKNTELTESLRKQVDTASAASAELETMRAKLKEVAICEQKQKSDAEKSHVEISRLKSLCDQLRDEAHRQRDATAGECSELRQQLQSKEFEIYSLQADLEMHRQAAEAFRAKYEKAEKVDHTHVATDGTTVDALHQLKAYKDEVARLKEQIAAQAVSGASLELAKRSSRQAEVADGDSGAAADLLKQLEAQKTKNNELRERNWKLMEALKEAEKQPSRAPASAAAAHPAKDVANAAAAPSPTTISLSEFKAVIARLYPTLRIDSQLGDSAWLTNFESAVRKHSEDSEGAGSAPSLLERRELLLEADRMLAALQQKLDKEEKVWRQEASLKDLEIAELRRQLQPSKASP